VIAVVAVVAVVAVIAVILKPILNALLLQLLVHANPKQHFTGQQNMSKLYAGASKIHYLSLRKRLKKPMAITSMDKRT
jgi:hypothetical protein